MSDERRPALPFYPAVISSGMAAIRCDREDVRLSMPRSDKLVTPLSLVCGVGLPPLSISPLSFISRSSSPSRRWYLSLFEGVTAPRSAPKTGMKKKGSRRKRRNPLFLLEPGIGLEPTTY